MPFSRIPFWKLLLYLLLSLFDLVLTWQLLQYGEGQVYESNPIVNWWLTHYGWLGLTAFKLVAVVVVGGLAAIICLHGPRTGRMVLSFVCAVLLMVVVYSCSLAGYIGAMPEGTALEQ